MIYIHLGRCIEDFKQDDAHKWTTIQDENVGYLNRHKQILLTGYLDL